MKKLDLEGNTCMLTKQALQKIEIREEGADKASVEF